MNKLPAKWKEVAQSFKIGTEDPCPSCFVEGFEQGALWLGAELERLKGLIKELPDRANCTCNMCAAIRRAKAEASPL